MLHRVKKVLCVLMPLYLVIALIATPVIAQSAPGLVDRFGRFISRGEAGPDDTANLPAETNQAMIQAAGDVALDGITPQATAIFKPYKAIPISGQYQDADAVGIGDFNSDGLNDVALTDRSYDSALWVFLQNRDGTLSAPVKYATGVRPETLAVGDLNHDGADDVAIGNFGSNTLGVFLQQSDGTLAAQVSYTTSTGPDAIAIADLNQDGWDDIAVSHWNAPYLGLFLQQADGTLAKIVTYPSPQAGYDDIDTGDFNNDGLTDIVKMSGQGYANPNLSVYLQKTEGGFNSPVSYDLAVNENSSGAAAGDITGDGLDDIALVYGGNSPSSKLTVLAQNSSGVMAFQNTYTSYDIPEPVEVADINLDGRKDVLTLHGGWQRLGVYLQNPDGSLAAEQLYPLPYASHYGPQGLNVGDINGDGGPDVVIGDYNYGLVILYNALVPDFALSALPAWQLAESGKTTQFKLDVSGIMSFNTPVNLSVENLPAGVTADISPNPVTPTGAATLTLEIEPTAPVGTYTLNIYGIGSEITRATTATLKIVQPITGLSATNNGPTLLGSTTQLKASIATGSGVYFSWDFGDGKKGSGATVQHTYSSLGAYTATVTAWNETGSYQASTVVTLVDVPITGLLTYAQQPAVVNLSTHLLATIKTGTNVTYHWDFGDGTSADGALVEHIYLKAKLYPVTLTASNSTSSVTQQFNLQISREGTEPGELPLPYSSYLPTVMLNLR